jgi:hypothetical protein
MCDSTIAMSNTKNKSKMLLSLLCVVTANITDCAETAAGGSPAATAGDNDNPPAAGKRRITLVFSDGTRSNLEVDSNVTFLELYKKIHGSLSVPNEVVNDNEQLQELLGTGNSEMVLTIHPFRQWQIEFREWLTGVRAFLLDINGGATYKTGFIREKIGWISEKLEPLFDNQLNLRDATLLKYNRGDGIGLEWPAGQGRIRLSIATPDTDTPLWHSIVEYLPGPDESQREYFFYFTDKHLVLPGMTKVALNRLRAQPKIPTSIFTQLESEYKSVDNNAALFPSEA